MSSATRSQKEKRSKKSTSPLIAISKSIAKVLQAGHEHNVPICVIYNSAMFATYYNAVKAQEKAIETVGDPQATCDKQDESPKEKRDKKEKRRLRSRSRSR